MSRRGGDRDAARRAGWRDRDDSVYERKRAQQARKRAEIERRNFDPSPPEDDDWTVAEEETDGVRRVSPPTPIGESLGTFLRRKGWQERLRASTAWSRWPQLVGEDLAERCEPVRLAGGTLVVRAENQVWATQLRYLTAQLRTNVEAELGAGTVREVRIVVGPLEGRTAPEGET